MGGYGGQSAVAPLRSALVSSPSWCPGQSADWRETWGYPGEPDLQLARAEHRCYVELLEGLGVAVHNAVNPEPDLYDMVFTCDAALMTDRGAVMLRSGKACRRRELAPVERCLAGLGVPVIYRVAAPFTADGGDFLWLRPDLLLVGRSYRTTVAGDPGFLALMDRMGVRVVPTPVPHWRGPGHVMHLLSLLSLVDRGLAVAFTRLLAVETLQLLAREGIALLEVPPAEFAGGLGANVLAVAPGHCIMAAGHPGVSAALAGAGISVSHYSARQLGHHMGGGPTCMVLPLLRDAAPA